MPLLRRKPFDRIKPPSDLRGDEEVFYCTLTKEVFRDYDQFYERIILCNSLVWSCALTGKPNLTYGEAIESERAAKELIKSYSKELQIPTLFIASLTRRTGFLDMLEDVWSFLKDRYFVNEILEDHTEGILPVLVTKVIYNAPIANGTTPTKSPGKNNKIFNLATDPANYSYEIVSLDNTFSGKKIVPGSSLRRPKTNYNREKQKLFLRTNTETGTGGYVKIKEYAIRKYKLNDVSFSSIFAGPEPVFQPTKKEQRLSEKISQAEKEQKRREIRNQRRKEKRQQMKEAKLLGEHQQNSQSSPSKRKSTDNRTPLKNGNVTNKNGKSGNKPGKKKKLTPEQEREQKLEQARLEKEAEKQRKLEERLKARKKAREEKRRLDDFHKEWSKPREDLLCEDLRELPKPCMVQCRIPNHLFGEFVSILEFMTNFNEALSVNDIFPKGITFDILERAFVEKEIAGPMSELLQLLLENIFTMQEQEEAEVKTSAPDLDDKGEFGDGETEGTLEEAIREATRAASWSQTYQGSTIGKLNLDSTTISEILRLHLYSSGGRCNEINSAWRFQQRGGYTLYDDPGLSLRMSDPQILRALKYKTVVELSIEEKLKIVTCLIHQIMMFASIRDIIGEKVERLMQLRKDLKNLQALEKRRETEDVNWKRDLNKKTKDGENEESHAAQYTVEEAEVEKQKRDKDSAKKKADFLTKEGKLLSEIVALERSVTAAPIGRDRAYRRYWVFQSLSGLFVEHDDDTLGPCLDNGTPSSKIQLCEDPLDYVKNLFVLQQRGEETTSSDKENERSPHSKKPLVLSSNNKRLEDDDELLSNNIFTCTGDTDSCPVHSTVLPRVHWSFFNRPEELDRLLASLNPRGYRESELRQTIIDMRANLENILAKCPAHLLGRPEDEKIELVEARRSSRQNASGGNNKNRVDANFNFEPGTPMATILESTFRESLLDLEEKIHLGGLGSLKIENREAWRQSIENGDYDSQCERLTWGGGPHPQHEIMLPTDKLINKLKSQERSASRPDTPDSLESGPTFQDPVSGEVATGEELNATVHNLACALLQVKQALEPRYIKDPLGESEKEKIKRQKKLLAAAAAGISPPEKTEDNEEEKEKKVHKTLLERWEMSLMSCSSFSQLYIHFYTLDNSVTWAKSALNARCRVCRRKGDGENMLLCDGCDKGHHIYCLKPILKDKKSIPTGEWFCPNCKPRQVPPTPRKSRRNFSAEESEDEDDDDEDEDGSGGEDEVNDSMEVDEEAEDEEEMEEEEETVCNTCSETGDLVTCEECRISWHPECSNPRLRVVPRSAWTCQDCRDAAEKKKKKGKRHGKVVLGQQSVSQRRCAREASNKIAKATKRLRSSSWDDTDSSRAASSTDDPDINGREQRVRRRPRWLTVECEDPDLPINAGLLGVLITDLMTHGEAWPFLRPVQKAEAPDYHQIIKKPMDLGTIKYRLNNMMYRTNEEFLSNALLVFDNCETYNPIDAEEYKAGVNLRKYFERKCQELGLKLPEDDFDAPEAKKARRQI